MMLKVVSVLGLMAVCSAIPVDEKEVIAVSQSPVYEPPPPPLSAVESVNPTSAGDTENNANADLKTDSSLWWGGYHSYPVVYRVRPRYYYTYPTYNYWRTYW